MSCKIRHLLVGVAGSLLLASCGSGSGAATTSLDTMSEAKRKETMEKTVQNTMDKNIEAMKAQGLNPPEGGGFQPPESMKKYMNKGGGGAPGGGSSGGSAPAGGSQPGSN